MTGALTQTGSADSDDAVIDFEFAGWRIDWRAVQGQQSVTSGRTLGSPAFLTAAVDPQLPPDQTIKIGGAAGYSGDGVGR